MKTILLIVFVMLCVSTTALAAPPILPGGQPIYFQFNNMEQVDTTLSNNIMVPGGYNGTNTQGNWGVINISTIQLGAVSLPHLDIAGGPVFWSDDGPGGTEGQIVGIFYGIQLTSGTTATGGVMDIYWYDAGSDSITAACLSGGCAPDAATVGIFTGGTFLARLKFDSGIITGDSATTIQSSTNITVTLSGRSDSFASVDIMMVGPWSNVLNGDWFWVDPNGDGTSGGPGEKRDVRFSTFYNGLPSWNGPEGSGIQGLRSNDPARVLTALCGDGIVNQIGETCDPPGSNAGQPNECRQDCTYCGDGHLDAGELCDDGNNINGDGCSATCNIERCGDGIVGNSPGETCDPPGTPAGASGNICRNDCTVCGDGIKQTGEQCDDGNNISGDGCENNCAVTPICGDGIVGNTPGETCDPPGSNAGQPNECRADCTYCGDGYLDASEECDDGNNINGDGCSAACTSEQLFGGCRMTGGHNTVAPDGSYYVVPGGSDVLRNVVSSGKKNTTTTTQFKYTVGGQIGAPQAGCCTPGVDCAPGNGGYGEWEHSHHENGTLKFSFHAGTHSAPPDSYIQCITCTDPGWCVQARCAPFKQIFWEGTGVFQNPNQKSDSPFTLSGCTIDPNAGKTHSLHYYKAHVGDFGEPGNTGKQKSWDSNVCHWTSGGVDVENTVLMTPQPPVPDPKFGDKGGQSCDACPDWYEIEVHCTASPSSPIIYRAAGYLTGGNHQIHPEVGQQCPY